MHCVKRRVAGDRRGSGGGDDGGGSGGDGGGNGGGSAGDSLYSTVFHTRLSYVDVLFEKYLIDRDLRGRRKSSKARDTSPVVP